jgi:hypothetical protein
VIPDSANVEEECDEASESEMMMSWKRMMVTSEVVSSSGFSFQL